MYTRLHDCTWLQKRTTGAGRGYLGGAGRLLPTCIMLSGGMTMDIELQNPVDDDASTYRPTQGDASAIRGVDVNSLIYLHF